MYIDLMTSEVARRLLKKWSCRKKILNIQNMRLQLGYKMKKIFEILSSIIKKLCVIICYTWKWLSLSLFLDGLLQSPFLFNWFPFILLEHNARFRYTVEDKVHMFVWNTNVMRKINNYDGCCFLGTSTTIS